MNNDNITDRLALLDLHERAEHVHHVDRLRAEHVRHADQQRVIEIARRKLTALRVARAAARAAAEVADAAESEAEVAWADIGAPSARSVERVEAASRPMEPASTPQVPKAASKPTKPAKKVPAAKKVSVLELQLISLLRAAEGPVKPDELIKELAGRGRTLKVSSVRTTLSHSALFMAAPKRQGWVLAAKAKGVEVPDDLWPTPAPRPIALRRLNGAAETHAAVE